MRRLLALMAGVALSLLALTPQVQADCYTFENTFGATNICGIVGNGGMVAALSCRGEITVLRWPSPTHYEQMLYLSSNAADARRLPRFGALESMGAFWGLKLRLDDGSTIVSWLRDEPWQAEAVYLHPYSGILVHRYSNDELGLHAISYALIDPELDVFAWRVELERSSGSPVKTAQAIFYANPSPCNIKAAYAPLIDWMFDFRNDFAAIYLDKEDVILHFLPKGKSLDELDPLMKASEPERYQKVRELYNSLAYRKGIYLAIGSDGRSKSFQIGKDDTDTCGFLKEFISNIDWGGWGLPDWLGDISLCSSGNTDYIYQSRMWNYWPESAYADAQDGTLSKSIAAAVQVDEAIVRDILAEGQSSGSATIYIAASDNARGAVDLLNQARSMGWNGMYARTEGFWQGWLSWAWLPDTDDEPIKSFYLRTLISAKQTQDRTTGARPASISSQPPYAQDWPRDSAFVNYFLDMAGYRMEAEFNDMFFASVARPNQFLIAPPGSYEMNYYADGMAGGPLFFEIDNTGLILWQMVEHARFLTGKQRTAYLNAVYPTIRRSAEGLANCRDPENGLQCLAWEDDSLSGMSQSIHGASTTLAALKNALWAAYEVDEGEEFTSMLEERLEELEAAIMENFYEEQNGFNGNYSGRSWILWPARIFDYSDPRWETHITKLLDEAWKPIKEEVELFAYQGKGAWAVAQYCRERGDEECLADLRDWVEQYIALAAIPGTLHVGEVYCRVDLDGDGQFDTVESSISIPHLWPAALLSATALLAYGAVEPNIPLVEPKYGPLDSEEEPKGDGEDSGCGCYL